MTSQSKVWVALVVIGIIAIGAYYYPKVGGTSASFGTAVDCGSTTCFTTVGILTSLQVDGTAVFNGTVTQGATTLSSLTVSGLTTLTGTTTEAAGFIQTKNPACLQFFPTSTATTVKLTFAATTSAVTTNTGVIPVVTYGNCSS